MLIGYYYSIDSCFFYSEVNIILLGNELNIVKYLFDGRFFFFFEGVLLKVFFYFFFYFSLSQSVYSSWKSLKGIFFRSILNSLFFQYGHFKVEGRGYKLYHNLGNVVMKLGYSHLCYYLIPFQLFFFSKKKKSDFKIVGFNRSMIGDTLKSMQLFRIPNNYKKKGLFFATK